MAPSSSAKTTYYTGKQIFHCNQKWRKTERRNTKIKESYNNYVALFRMERGSRSAIYKTTIIKKWSFTLTFILRFSLKFKKNLYSETGKHIREVGLWQWIEADIKFIIVIICYDNQNNNEFLVLWYSWEKFAHFLRHSHSSLTTPTSSHLNSSLPNNEKWSKCFFTNEWERCATRRSWVTLITQVWSTYNSCTC